MSLVRRQGLAESLLPFPSCVILDISFNPFNSCFFINKRWIINSTGLLWGQGFPQWLSNKESSCNARDADDVALIAGLGRSLGGGHGNPLQYYWRENPVDRGAWQATIHGISKSWTQLKWLSIKGIRWNDALKIFSLGTSQLLSN